MARQRNSLSSEEIKEGLVGGQLTLIRRLGEGSFGEVVQAQHKVSDEYYAVKMLIYSEGMETYRKREVGALTSRAISNQHIIQYFNCWVSTVGDKQVLSIQMEWCLDSLHRWLATSPHIVKLRALYKHVFPQILKGLDAIHRAGWVHRDLHPANILINIPPPEKIEDINIKIADFGLARQIQYPDQPLTLQPKLDDMSSNVGHKLFRAPEIATSVYDYKVDLYSAGIILYILSCYVENADHMKWDQEITKLREVGVMCGNLCHKSDDMLVNLIGDLMKTEPNERPTASEALDRFSISDNQSDILPCAVVLEFRARKEGENYKRCSSVGASLAGIKKGIEKKLGIPQENQVIFQDVDGIPLDVESDGDVEKMVKSAEEKSGGKICLSVRCRQEETATATTKTEWPDVSIDSGHYGSETVLLETILFETIE